ncbi:hypothetical protein O6H91_16G081300 [Diphasiastrum complanatum]|uniref:Uncharacterized protein n=1 Tax=Diphasiastrum complanatum TaxID=34168 RepID=A0ACC2BEB3_DIPCM|nr:hypothetical protein O6H91_16G081300 [Diphasiastrum complanatum]
MVRGRSAGHLRQIFHCVHLHMQPCSSFASSRLPLRCQLRQLSCLPSAPTYPQQDGISIFDLEMNGNNESKLSYWPYASQGGWNVFRPSTIHAQSPASYQHKCLSGAKHLSTGSLSKYGLKDAPPRIKSKRSSSVPRKAKLRRKGIRGAKAVTHRSVLKIKAGNYPAAAVARRPMSRVIGTSSERESSIRSKGINRQRQQGSRSKENLSDSKSREDEMERSIGRKTTVIKFNSKARINPSATAIYKPSVAGFRQKKPSDLDATAGRPEFKGEKRKVFVTGHKKLSTYKIRKGRRDSKAQLGEADRPEIIAKLVGSKRDPVPVKEIDEKTKIKRVMRLDPRDNTRKRIDEGHQLQAKSGLLEMQSGEKNVSNSALFRAIQPSEQLLDHIEKLMLGRRRLIEWRKAGYDVKLKAPLDDIPLGKKDERQPITDNIFRNKLKFVAAAKQAVSLPAVVLPEVAFAGRSNVGKSSLINALTRQWGVARTSEKPGLTQTINFFNLGSRLCLVDLPGYGFAFAKEETKEAWEEFVKEFVVTRKGLKRVCVLVDAKWGLKPRDEELLSLMERAQTKYQIVLTKTDALSPLDLARRATQVQDALKSNKSLVQPVMMVSAKTGGGIPAFRTSLAKLVVT